MKIWKLYFLLAFVALVFGGGLFLGYKLFTPSVQKTEITAQTILTALKDRGFLVTQTFVFDEPVTITKSSGSAFRDFFFGQTITARGVMEVNMGIDLAKVSADNVKIDGDIITVSTPGLSVFNVRLIGPVDVKNDQGILKRILENDDGYNEALSELSKQAEVAAKNPELLKRAQDSGTQEITRLLGFVAQGKKILVNVSAP